MEVCGFCLKHFLVFICKKHIWIQWWISNIVGKFNYDKKNSNKSLWTISSCVAGIE